MGLAQYVMFGVIFFILYDIGPALYGNSLALVSKL